MFTFLLLSFIWAATGNFFARRAWISQHQYTAPIFEQFVGMVLGPFAFIAGGFIHNKWF